MRQTRWFLVISAAMALCGLTACHEDVCSQNSDCPAGQACLNGSCALACTSNDACGAGKICHNGACIVGCATHADCGAGQFCSGKSCMPGCVSDLGCQTGFYCNTSSNQCISGCMSNANCATGYFCSFGICVQSGINCIVDVSCGSGMICESGACVSGCRDNTNCMVGQECQNGQCQNINKPDPCSACTFDQTCENGVCVNKPDPCAGCTSDQTCVNGVCVNKTDPCSACTSDQTCVNGVCVNKTDPCAACTSDQTCENGVCVDKHEDSCLSCTSEQTCENGVCVDIIKTECQKDTDCPNGKVCNEDFKCVVPTGECTMDIQCGECKICKNNKCIEDPACVEPECTTNAQCGNCQICQNNTCVEDPQCNVSSCLDEPVGNVVPNWDFEQWNGNLPKFWNAEKDIIYSKSSDAYSCDSALKIENELTSNSRMASDVVNLPVGRYSCSLWMKGTGTVRFGARVPADSNTYKYSGEQKLYGTEEFHEYTYSLNVSATNADSVPTSFILAIKYSENPHVIVDSFSCVRQTSACDNVTCKDWEKCNNGTCTVESGRCNASSDCSEWKECNTQTHYCEVASGRCESNSDCTSGSMPMKCDKASHQCVSGDPCADIKCPAWKVCNPMTAQCDLPEGNCTNSNDCLKDKPACDPATHTCQPATHSCNVFPNGGFESWDIYYIPYYGDNNLLPDEWYGLFDDLQDHTAFTEIKPSYIKQYTKNVHSGQYAMQITQPNGYDRLASEDFSTPVNKKTTCSYWVRGKGGVRHRGYSNLGWTTMTDRIDIDTDEWIRIPFELPSNASHYRFILYVSYTDPAKDHVVIDDVVCTIDDI